MVTTWARPHRTHKVTMQKQLHFMYGSHMGVICVVTGIQRKCVLSTLALDGSAGTFVSTQPRVLKENPQISWQNLKIRIKERYAELTDPLMPREKCRHLKQKQGNLFKISPRGSTRLPPTLSTTFGFRMFKWSSWTCSKGVSQMAG